MTTKQASNGKKIELTEERAWQTVSTAFSTLARFYKIEVVNDAGGVVFKVPGAAMGKDAEGFYTFGPAGATFKAEPEK